MFKGTILICDDEEEILRYLKKLLQTVGLSVVTFTRGEELLEYLERTGSDGDLLIQDIRMPGVDGIEVLQRVRELRPALPVIIMTAYGTIDSAVEAIKLGAYDYVTKPFPKEKILTVLGKALERELLIQENRALKEELLHPSPRNIVFVSRTFQEIYDLTLRVAASEANILVLGESGTGKELIAGAIHDNSPRRGRRFLSINCAALADNLLESQLFGHVRGAFTGAVTTQKGLLEEADSGTMFLDEIGDMSLATQAKLLRVIQERDFIAVGGTKPRKVDIRFVAATNKDLETEVKNGRFREDLFYRLNVIGIQLPPLRERREDIEPLARHFLKKHGRRMNREVSNFSADALQILNAYHWPGNIRELENVVERGVILARDGMITADLLPILKGAGGGGPAVDNGTLSLERIELDHIRKVLAKEACNKSRTAEILGISRKTLDRKIAEYGLEVIPPHPEKRSF